MRSISSQMNCFHNHRSILEQYIGKKFEVNAVAQTAGQVLEGTNDKILNFSMDFSHFSLFGKILGDMSPPP